MPAKVVVGLRVVLLGLCQLLDGSTALVYHEDIGVEAACWQVEHNLLGRLVDSYGQLLAEVLGLIAGGQQVYAAFHIDRQIELQVVSRLGGVDDHHDE